MTGRARRSGLDAPRAVLRRHNPGNDIIIEAERADFVLDTTIRQIVRRLPAPHHPDTPVGGIDVPAPASRRADTNESAGELSGDFVAASEDGTSLVDTEARAKSELDRRLSEKMAEFLFVRWRGRCRNDSPKIKLTDQREKATRSRASRDAFSDAALPEAVEDDGDAVEAQVLDYEHRDTKPHRIMVAAEHVKAWIEYRRTGDPDVLDDLVANVLDDPVQNEPTA